VTAGDHARVKTRALASPALVTLILGLAGSAHADEGMWPFEMAPLDRIQKDHGVTLTKDWLDHVRLSSVRFGNGGSGSFVSKTGLVLTNAHVASDCVGKLGNASKDYVANGFRAGPDGDELKCPDLELNVTVAMQDVTDQVRAAKLPSMNDADANTAIKAAMTGLEKGCHEQTGKKCEVVTLYAGGKYELYTYDKYTDVRLVFAPEHAIAFFGGDPENFTYPRFDYDMAIFRVYANGAALQPTNWLEWNAAGPKENDTVFVSGHPGSTGRLETVAQLHDDRDLVLPFRLGLLREQIALLDAFGRNGSEEKREADAVTFGLRNGQKAFTGYLGALKDPALMKKKSDDEARLREAIDADPKLKTAYGTVVDEVAAVEKHAVTIYPRYMALEWFATSKLVAMARQLVRLPAETALPNDKRLREFRDTNLDSMKLQLLAGAPIYGGVNAPLVRTWLELMARTLGANDPLVKQVLAGRTPSYAAQEIVAQTKLFDAYARRALLDGGADAVAKSTDPLVVLLRTIDPAARAARKQWDDEVEAPLRTLGTKVAEASFAVRGTSVSPDATFTLRLSIGTVKGFGATPWATTYGGLFAHATKADPLKLPQSWLDAKAKLDPKTPMNFVSTDDIIGGNSGSPVVDAGGKLVGLIFDGNITSLGNRYVYGDTTQRAVSVDSACILDALRTVYGEGALANEIAGSAH
jgi:hypothetical protein